MAFNDLAARILIQAQDLTGRAVKSARDGLTSISTTAEQVYGAAKAYLTFSFLHDAVTRVVGLADTFKNLQARLKLATDSEAAFATASRELNRIADDTRSALESVVTLYARTASAVQALGGSQQQSLDLTRAIAEALQISGASAGQAAAGILQLSQALASGVLRGDEFNSVMENAPRLAQALADGLGVPIGALRKLAEAGQLTADKVIGALLSQKETLAAEYATLPVTAGGAFQQLQNRFLEYVGQVDAASGASAKLAGALQGAAQLIPTLGSTVGALAIIYGAQLSKSLLAAASAQIQSIQASRQAVIAAREEAAAKQQALALAAADAKARLGLAAALEREALTRQAAARAAASELATAAARKELEAAERGLLSAINARDKATRELATAQQALDAATSGAVSQVSGLTRALDLLNKGLLLVQAYEIGKTIGEWANQFEVVRAAGSRLAEGFTLLGTAIGHVFSGDAFRSGGPSLLDKLREVHAAYAELAEAAEQAATRQGAAHDQAAQSAQQATAPIHDLAQASAGAQDSVKQLFEQFGRGAELGNAGSLRTLIEQLNQVGASTVELEQHWQHFLGSLDSAQLAAVGRAATENVQAIETALGQGAEQGRVFGQIIDQTLRESFQRLGLDADEALTGIGGRTRAALTDFQALRDGLAATGLTGEKAGAILVQAFSQVLARAGTIEELAAAQTSLDQLRAAGVLSAQQLAAAETALAARKAEVSAATRAQAEALERLIQSSSLAGEESRAAAAAAQQEAAARRQAAEASQQQSRATGETRSALVDTAAAQFLLNERYGQATSLLAVMDQQLGFYSQRLVELRQRVDAATQGTSDFFAGIRFGNDLLEQAAGQLAQVQELTRTVEEATRSGHGLGQALAQVGTVSAGVAEGFDLLDRQHFDGLRSAIDSARQKMDALNDSARSTLNGLRDQLDQLNGDTTAIEQRRYAEDTAKLNRQIADAEASGNSQALADLQQALAIRGEIYQRTQQQMRLEEAQRRQAETPSSAGATSAPLEPRAAVPATSVAAKPPASAAAELVRPEPALTAGKTLRVELVAGDKSVTLSAAADQEANLLDLLRRAKAVTLQ